MYEVPGNLPRNPPDLLGRSLRDLQESFPSVSIDENLLIHRGSLKRSFPIRESSRALRGFVRSKRATASGPVSVDVQSMF